MVRTSGRGRRSAFTLVELLVVVSIIALLVAMIVPSLRKAREQGRRLVCAAHLKGLGTSWEIYTIEYDSPPRLARRGVDVNYDCPTSQTCERDDYHGFGPDTFDAYLSGNSDNQVWLSATSYRHVLFQVSNPPPAGPLPGHYWNWGLMWLSGIVENPEVFFCPSIRDPDFAWNTPINPWPPSKETMWRPDHPSWVNHTQSSYERRIALTGVPWDRIPSKTAIAHDMGMPNINTQAHKTGGNIAFRDSHVSFIRSTHFVDWWQDSDSWIKETTHRRLLEYSYWLDSEGTYDFDPTVDGR